MNLRKPIHHFPRERQVARASRSFLRGTEVMRILDFVAGLFILPALGLPLALFTALGLRFDVTRTLVVGRSARLFWRRLLVFKPGPFAELANRLGLAHFLDGLSLLRGDLALVGPRPLPPLAPHAVASYRIALRPGLGTPFEVQPWDQFGFDTEDSVDFAYAANRTWTGDLAILLHVLSTWAHDLTHARPTLGASK